MHGSNSPNDAAASTRRGPSTTAALAEQVLGEGADRGALLDEIAAPPTAPPPAGIFSPGGGTPPPPPPRIAGRRSAHSSPRHGRRSPTPGQLYIPLAAYLARRFAGRGEPLD